MQQDIEAPQDLNRPRKSQLCRFYLRGLCMLKSCDCHFSHGVWDLDYSPHLNQVQIIYDHSKIKKQDKYEKIVKGPRSYVNLYDYQIQKIFTLQQLNEDRAKRSLIRNQMHQQMFNQFMDLLQCYYPQANFTAEFLIRQFSRVGFNKIMASIKISHIASMVCDPPNSRFYLHSLKIPPYLNKEVTFIVPMATQKQIEQFYREQYEQILDKGNKQLTQNQIKKHLFSICRPSLSIMPLNLFLKKKKMNFSNFLKSISNEAYLIVDQVDQNTLFQSAVKFINMMVAKQGYCSWNQVYKNFGQQFKINNANITNPIKPRLIQAGFYFLNFPMIQIISTQDVIFSWKKQYRTCECPYHQMFSEEQLLIEILTIQQVQKIFPPKQSLDIYDVQTLMKCAPALLHSKILGVDIQGRLRKGGYIEMIQINTGRNTFLIDVYRMLLNGDMQAFQLTKKIMRNIMSNPQILKIFHDCRHDSLVLHQVMNTCIVNIFDTSAVQTLRGQLKTYKQKKDSPKTILKTIGNVKTSGLNQILKNYHAPHGINKNKQWFHELWRKGKTQMFQMRPLDPNYREYCIKDVLDLLHVHKQMSEQLCSNFTEWISSFYVRQGYLYLTEEK